MGSDHDGALLLLPPAPEPPSYFNCHAAYHAPLCAVLNKVDARNTAGSEGKILDIALPCDFLSTGTSRADQFEMAQTALASVYKLIAKIAADQNLNVEDREGIDVRIILLGSEAATSTGTAESDLTGPLISIGTLARSGRNWWTVFVVQTEQGDHLWRTFSRIAGERLQVEMIRGGIVIKAQSAKIIPSTANGPLTHHHVAVGGTFDHLHIGHKLLLTMFAFILDKPPASASYGYGQSLTIGITAGALLENKKYAEYLESWAERQKAAWRFLSAILSFRSDQVGEVLITEQTEDRTRGRVITYTLPTGLAIKFVEIWDPFGPTVTDEAIDTLVLSWETRSGGKAVNDKRRELGWKELDVFEVDVLDTGDASSDPTSGTDVAQQNFEGKLSSTSIRQAQHEKRMHRGKF